MTPDPAARRRTDSGAERPLGGDAFAPRKPVTRRRRLAEHSTDGVVQRRGRERDGRLSREAAALTRRDGRIAFLLERPPGLLARSTPSSASNGAASSTSTDSSATARASTTPWASRPGQLAAAYRSLRAHITCARSLRPLAATASSKKVHFLATASSSVIRTAGSATANGMPGIPAPAPRSSQAPPALAQLRHLQGEGVADERVDHGDRVGEPGHVGAAPAQQQAGSKLRERFRLRFVKAVRGDPFERRPRPEVVDHRPLPSPVNGRRLGEPAASSSTSGAVICQGHIRRTTPASSSQT